MRFLVPAALALLVLIPLLGAFLFWRMRVREQVIHLLGNIDLLYNLFPRSTPAQRYLKSVLWLAALTALFVAIARPVWGVDIDIVETQGVSVMFVLDVSNSMNAEDALPNRLERAKLSVQEMFKGLAGNELGVILFAGSAFVQFPLTTDIASAETFLKAVSTHSISRQGTDIDAALQLAIDAFDKARSTKRFIVLLSDGENLQGDPLSMASNVREQGITIYTIGYGEAKGAPIPVKDQNGQITSYKSDQSGKLVLSTLDEPTLQAIASRAGGNYQHANPNGDEAQWLIDLINQGQPSVLNRSVQSYEVERFEIFVALALLALTLEIGLPESSRKAV